MKKVLIMVAHRPDRSPSQRYRFEQYLPFLEANGFQFSWSPLLNEEDDKLFYSAGNFFGKVRILVIGLFHRFRDMRNLKHYDIVFVQREAYFLGTSFFERRVVKKGKKLIYDFDDAIWMADTSPGNQKWEWLKKPNKIFEIIAVANHVIAGNQYLVEKTKAFNAHTTLIPTTVNTEIHKPLNLSKDSDNIVIGWSGSISTIKHFELILSVLKKIKAKYADKVMFKIIGDPYYINAELGIKGEEWSSENEVAQLNSFDIGIMPLPDDEWSKGKCGLKALTCMACAVPVIASAVGVNTQIIQQGENGFLTENEQDWLTYLDQLIMDKELRKRIGESGRKTVVERYSTQAHQNDYLKVFSEV